MYLPIALGFLPAILVYASEDDWKDLFLPLKHLPYIFAHHPQLAESCIEDATCPYQLQARKVPSCWGYETNCDRKKSYSWKEPQNCSSVTHKNDFWTRADFGYIAQILTELKHIKICSPQDERDSSLICSRNMKYCHAKNLYIDFRSHKPKSDRYKDDMFEQGMIGGHCDFNSRLLNDQGQHPSPLQSWYSELQNFTSLGARPLEESQKCDVIIDKPTIFMKLDSGINIYHHFCDFFNLYLSQHVNNSWFGRDVQIVMWDTSSSDYFDIVQDAWKAYTKYPVKKLRDFTGKSVCFLEAIFSLLPRMRGGLYYNTYIPNGCVGSSMFRSFTEHFLHRMGIKQDLVDYDSSTKKIRVTLLQRGKPENDRVFRQIKNQKELVDVMKEFEDFDIKVVEYNWRTMPFVEQLRITHNSDIFIGMHGAGLLHFLFLPEWAVAFELYNCGDPGCYYDLARLRGVDYLTWGNGKVQAFDQGKHKRYGDNPKFWNWSFDIGEFRKLLEKARDLLLNNKKFHIRKMYGKHRAEL